MEGVLPGGPGALGPGESMKKAGAEGRSCSSLMWGRQEKDHNGTRVTGFRPHSMRSIAINTDPMQRETAAPRSRRGRPATRQEGPQSIMWKLAAGGPGDPMPGGPELCGFPSKRLSGN